MTSMLVGLIFIILGALGIFSWFGDFVLFLKAVLPISLLVGGFVALIAGITTLRARRSHGKK